MPVSAGTDWVLTGAAGGRLRIGVRVNGGGGRLVSSVLILAADEVLLSEEGAQGSGPGAKMIEHWLNLERKERAAFTGGGDVGGEKRGRTVGVRRSVPGIADCQGAGWGRLPGGRTGVSARS